MMRHVLLISVGPVQDFIAAARRSRDLWFGSWVLSELSKAAAAAIVRELGGDAEALQALVFPAPEGAVNLVEASSMSVANKLVVRVSGDAARVRAVAEKGHEGLKRRRDALGAEAFGHIGRNDPRRGDHFLEDVAVQQLGELFEYQWVAVREGEGANGYALARDRAEQILGARKNTRTWKQPEWGTDGVPKSSLDGVRESVLHEDLYDRPVNGPPRPPALTPEQRRKQYGVHGAERLCGVGLLKRWGVMLDDGGRRRIERFFSTAHVAALPIMFGIDGDVQRRPALRAAWSALLDAAGDAAEEFEVVPRRATELFGRTDGSILFPQRLVETLGEYGHDPASQTTRAALDAQRRFLKLADRGEPVPYYGILVADGDGMGKVIEAQTDHEAHQALSRALDGFARNARDIILQHDGSLIYSGGDDVLAFLPLHQAIECAEALALRFRDALARWKNKDGQSATLSAGLGIVHYLDPMGAGLEVAREAEKKAKQRKGKDALAIMLDKRSGGRTVVCGPWDPLAPRLRALATLHRVEAIPDKAGHELEELARLSEGAGRKELPALRAIQASEASRILGRKRAKRGKEAIAAATLKQLAAHLGEEPAELGRELFIAGLIARAKDQAEPRNEEET